MTTPSRATSPRMDNPLARQRPTGWPVGSFDTYANAQRAVDTLADNEFPVEHLTIVGVDLMQVENVTGRLTWPRVLGGGLFSGAWMGLFIGLIFALFATPGAGWTVILTSLIIGAIFGLIFAAASYALTGGKRDFASATTIVAGRYDVLCDPATATRARDAIAQMDFDSTPANTEHTPRYNEDQRDN
ncbi:general stress protein [Corynebacterium sp.]|uniref:general stress protein n=1 Tax=Corynebacterium sp. TaxID=1720 RepID=UPI002A914C56|nr:general stress protein [Corynebacterium sp.]MDY5784788.1 general stress protein [Corynebacterium sp.]